MIQTLPLKKIRPAPDNPRKEIGDVAGLAASIKAEGLLQPILVTPRNGSYVIVAGSRRYAAAAAAGLTEIDALVRDMDEPARIEAMAVENLQREDLTPLEEAQVYRQLLAVNPGMTQHQLAERLGVSQARISKRIVLLDLPKDVQKSVDSGRIGTEDAAALARLAGSPNLVKQAASLADQYGGIPRAVDDLLRHKERAEKQAAEINRVKQAAKDGKGPAYVAVPQHGLWNLDKKKYRTREHLDYGESLTTVAKPIAVTVKDDGARVLLYSPKDVKRTRTGRGLSATEKKMREQQKRAGQLAEHRRAFVKERLAGKIRKDAALELVLLYALARAGYQAEEGAVELLGIEIEKKGPGDYEARGRVVNAAIEKDALRVGLASALAWADGLVQTGDDRFEEGAAKRLARAYRAWLAGEGYKAPRQAKPAAVTKPKRKPGARSKARASRKTARKAAKRKAGKRRGR